MNNPERVEAAAGRIADRLAALREQEARQQEGGTDCEAEPLAGNDILQ
jgi:hypothetical protein